jgi:phosphoserine phosphatase
MNLVVQGGVLTSEALAEIAGARAGRRRPFPLGKQRVASSSARAAGQIEQWCAGRRLDCAWVPKIAGSPTCVSSPMDMDSTLVTIESIDEMGDLLGIREKIAAGHRARRCAARSTTRKSLRRRVALLAGSRSSRWRKSAKSACISRRARRAWSGAAATAGIRTLLVSGGFSFFTAWLQQAARHRPRRFRMCSRSTVAG